MRHPHLVLTGFALMLLAQPALQAQSSRTWVSGVGSDANTCGRTEPCRTFRIAISKTFINGEVMALDSATYGAWTITRSITINGDEAFASVLTPGPVNAITINIAPNADDPKRRVHLRNLHINGSGPNGIVTGLSGINVFAASQVILENCLIEGFTQFGIDVNGPTNAQITVSNTTITDVGLSAIRIQDAGGTLRTHLRNLLIDTAGLAL